MDDVTYGIIILMIVVGVTLSVTGPIAYIVKFCNAEPPDIAPGDTYTVTDNNRTMLMKVMTGACTWS